MRQDFLHCYCPQLKQLYKDLSRFQQLVMRLLQGDAAPCHPILGRTLQQEPGSEQRAPHVPHLQSSSRRASSSKDNSNDTGPRLQSPMLRLNTHALARLVSMLGIVAAASPGQSPSTPLFSSKLPSPGISGPLSRRSVLGMQLQLQQQYQQQQLGDEADQPKDPIASSFCFAGGHVPPLAASISAANMPPPAPPADPGQPLPSGSPLSWPYAALKARRSK